MRHILIVLLTGCNFIAQAQQFKQEFQGDDILRFWEAFDKVTSTQDSALQYQYLHHFYLDKAGEGLKNLIIARRYSDVDFIESIKKYPRYYNNIRFSTLDYEKHIPEINKSINRLQQYYPDLKPAPICFAMGAFRSSGTIMNHHVLIGAELALASPDQATDELPAWIPAYLRDFQPSKNIALLCTHEYCHTQQTELADNLIAYCLYEGVAEFISCYVTGMPSNTPAIAFGKANEELVRNAFIRDMFTGDPYNWLWGENQNELKVRDLGYYIGYEICERYVAKASDKKGAIKALFAIDFSSDASMDSIIDAAGYFPQPMITYRQQKKP